MTGIVLIIIGITFLLKNLGIISSGAWGFIWPALLIVLGLWFLLRGRSGFFFEEHLGWRLKDKNKDRNKEKHKIFRV